MQNRKIHILNSFISKLCTRMEAAQDQKDKECIWGMQKYKSLNSFKSRRQYNSCKTHHHLLNWTIQLHWCTKFSSRQLETANHSPNQAGIFYYAWFIYNAIYTYIVQTTQLQFSNLLARQSTKLTHLIASYTAIASLS